MKKTCLFVCPVNLESHYNFNKIHLESLRKTYDLQVFTLRNQNNSFFNNLNTIYFDFNLSFQNLFPEFFLEFIKTIICFFKVKYIFNLSSFDNIIIATYHELPLYLVRFPRETYLINHNNLSGYYNSKNSLKKYIQRNIFKRYNHICLSKNSKDYMLKLTDNKVCYIQHGLPEPFINDIDENCIINNIIDLKNKFIFIPSLRNCDINFFEKLLNSDELSKFLEQNRLELIILSKKIFNIKLHNRNIKFIESWLNKNDYKVLFKNAKLIVLNYSDSFKYRSSGVFFECVSNNKKFITNYVDFLDDYKFYNIGNIIYNDLNSFIRLLKNEIYYSKENKNYNKEYFKVKGYEKL
tara:strand:- start:2141 stop:3193 length:1053 start_codon:yes stop_codon:yes gene_type:complete